MARLLLLLSCVVALCASGVWSFSSCQEARVAGQPSGETTITRNGAVVTTFCDQEFRGGAWEVLLNNVDQAGDLLSGKSWAEYAAGVGNAVHTNTTNWMLGLDDWHLLTGATSEYPSGFEVMVRGLAQSNGEWLWKSMSGFSLSDAASNYQFNVITNTAFGTLPNDGVLGYMNGRPFTAKDKDNDDADINCANDFSAGWWYGECHWGVFTAPITGTNTGNLYWKGDNTQHGQFLNAVQFLIRPNAFYPSDPITSSISSCQEARVQGLPDGVYWLQRNGALVQVFCEMDTPIGKGWEVLFSRGIAEQDLLSFNAGFDQYATGLNRGPLQGINDTYMLGLNDWHLLTQISAAYPTGFDIGFALLFTDDNQWHFESYGGLVVGDYAADFRLTLEGNGAGDAGWAGFEPPSHSNGLVFSAPDKDNDNHAINCADRYNSGWWFDACHCGLLTADLVQDFYWNGACNGGPGTSESLSAARIMIRPSSIAQQPPTASDPDVPVFSSCKQAQSLGRPSQPEWISRNGVTVQLYCMQESDISGGWEVLMNRHNRWHLSWDQAWTPYKLGINAGAWNVTDDYWIGLHDWTALTQATAHTYPDGYELALFVELDDSEPQKLPGEWLWQVVPDIKVGSEFGSNPYQLTGNFAEEFGTSGRWSQKIANQAFSTLGNDHDSWGTDCAASYGNGGWWYESCHWGVMTAARPEYWFINVDGVDQKFLQAAMMAIRPITSSEVSLETCMLAEMQTRLQQIQEASEEMLQNFNATFACQQAGASGSPRSFARWCSIRR